LYRLAWGVDDRPVEGDRETKSIGHEETFATDRHTHAELRGELVRLADAVAVRVRAHGGVARTLTLKVRFAGFRTITRSVTVADGVSTGHGIVNAVEPMLAAIDASPGVRLLGVSASNFTAVSEQLSIDDLLADRPSDDRQWQAAEETMDAIRQRFGSSAIGPASAVRGGALRVVRRGAQQWGPDEPVTQ
jgi:DNA polymerase-4